MILALLLILAGTTEPPRLSPPLRQVRLDGSVELRTVATGVLDGDNLCRRERGRTADWCVTIPLNPDVCFGQGEGKYICYVPAWRTGSFELAARRGNWPEPPWAAEAQLSCSGDGTGCPDTVLPSALPVVAQVPVGEQVEPKCCCWPESRDVYGRRCRATP